MQGYYHIIKSTASISTSLKVSNQSCFDKTDSTQSNGVEEIIRKKTVFYTNTSIRAIQTFLLKRGVLTI